MKDIQSFIYWAGVSDKAGWFLGIGAVLVLVIGFVAALAMGDEGDKRAPIVFIISASITLSMWCGALFVPSKGTLYAMAAAGLAGEAIESPEGQKARVLLNKAMDALGAKIDSMAETQSSSAEPK